MSLINVSLNELISLLKRACEIYYGPAMDYEVIAQYTLWLECHGMSGIKVLCERLKKENIRTNIEYQKNKTFKEKVVFDPKGGALSECAHIIADTLIYRASIDEICRVELHHAAEHAFLIPTVARCCRVGFNMFAIWQDAEAEMYHRVWGEAEQPCPQYLITEGEMEFEKSVTVIICARDKSRFWQEPTVASNLKELATQDADQVDLMGHYDRCVQEGVNIMCADYEFLTKVADCILVEATDESRGGAGE